MKRIVCSSCGADEFTVKDGFRICDYCGSRYALETKTTIALDDDVQTLLEKCKKEPYRAKRYAILILEIDPYNEEAKKYL